MTLKKSVSVFGVTGSIGASTIDVLKSHADKYAVEAVTAHRNVDALAKAAIELDAKCAVIGDPAFFGALQDALAGKGIELAAGEDALIEAAERPSDIVIAAIVGAAGLKPTLAAIRRGARIGLANKETLVCAGALMTAEITKHGATLIPVDSEHSAIFQVLEDHEESRVDRILLTASGGPFRAWPLDDMRSVTRAQALAHPNWEMELIEAWHLFPVAEEQIEIVVHPQSVVHSMVEYSDGSVLAQLGTPDMRTPIAYALSWPDRIKVDTPRLDFATIGSLKFEKPDTDRFPALRLARQALQEGGTLPTVLNAANEVAVEAFLKDRIGFLDIAVTVEKVMTRLGTEALTSLDQVFETDAMVRRETMACLASA